MKTIKLLIAMLLVISVSLFSLASCDILGASSGKTDINTPGGDAEDNNQNNEDTEKPGSENEGEDSGNKDDENSENNGSNEGVEDPEGGKTDDEGSNNGKPDDENGENNNGNASNDKEEQPFPANFYNLYDPAYSSLIADMIWVLPGESHIVAALFESRYPDNVSFSVAGITVEATNISPVTYDGETYFAVSAEIPAITAEGEYEFRMSYSSLGTEGVRSFRYIVDDVMDNPSGEAGIFMGVKSDSDATLDYGVVNVNKDGDTVPVYAVFSAPVTNLSLYIADLYIPYLTPTSEGYIAEGYIYRFDIETFYMEDGFSYNVMMSHGSSGFDQTNIGFLLEVGSSDNGNPNPNPDPNPDGGDVTFYGAMTEEMTGPADRVYVALGSKTNLLLCFSGKVTLKSVELAGNQLPVVSENESFFGYTYAVELTDCGKYEENVVNITYYVSENTKKCSVELIFGDGSDTNPDGYVSLDGIWDENYKAVESIFVKEGGETLAYLVFSGMFDVSTLAFPECVGQVTAHESTYYDGKFIVRIYVSGYYGPDTSLNVVWGEPDHENYASVPISVILPEAPEFLGAWSDDFTEFSTDKVTIKAAYGGETCIYLKFTAKFDVHTLIIGDRDYLNSYEWFEDGDNYILKITQSYMQNYFDIGTFVFLIEGAFGEFNNYPYSNGFNVEVVADNEVKMLGVQVNGGEIVDYVDVDLGNITRVSLVFNAPAVVDQIKIGDHIFGLSAPTIFMDEAKYSFEWELSYDLLRFQGESIAYVSFTCFGIQYEASFLVKVQRIELLKITDEYGYILTDEGTGYHVELDNDYPVIVNFVYSVAPYEVRMDRRGNGDWYSDYLTADLLGYDAKLGGYVARFTLYASDFEPGCGLKLTAFMWDNNDSTNPGEFDCANVLIVMTPEAPIPKAICFNNDGSYDPDRYTVYVNNGEYTTLYVVLSSACSASDLNLDLWVNGSYYRSIECSDVSYNGNYYLARFDYYGELPPFGFSPEQSSYIYKVSVRYGESTNLIRGDGAVAVYLIEVFA